MSACGRRMRATGSSPEETKSWRERRSSPGSGLNSLAFPTEVSGCESDVAARYSGGAAPAFHRFPCPALASNCERESRPPGSQRQARARFDP